MVNTAMPAAWNTAEVLDGLELADKAELIGIPFRVTGVWFSTGARNINYVYVEGERADGSTFTINDASTGVKMQLEEYCGKLNNGVLPDEDKPLAVSLVIPRGLRISKYDVMDPVTGKTREGKTYYLTTKGTRKVTTPDKTPGKARATAK